MGELRHPCFGMWNSSQWLCYTSGAGRVRGSSKGESTDGVVIFRIYPPAIKHGNEKSSINGCTVMVMQWSLIVYKWRSFHCHVWLRVSSFIQVFVMCLPAPGYWQKGGAGDCQGDDERCMWRQVWELGRARRIKSSRWFWPPFLATFFSDLFLTGA